jgi:hypothetical protein
MKTMLVINITNPAQAEANATHAGAGFARGEGSRGGRRGNSGSLGTV